LIPLLQPCAAITSIATCTTVSTSTGITPGTAVTYCAAIPSVTTCTTVSTSTGITPGTPIPYCAAITAIPSVATCATVSTSTGVTPKTAVHSIPYGCMVQSLLCWEFNDKIACHRYNRCSDGKHDDEDDEFFQGVRLLSFSHIVITSP
jgi:hypothetical protein